MTQSEQQQFAEQKNQIKLLRQGIAVLERAVKNAEVRARRAESMARTATNDINNIKRMLSK